MSSIIRQINEEYFNILENSQLFPNKKEINRENIESLCTEILEQTKLEVRHRGKIIPACLYYIEVLFFELNSFWKDNWSKICEEIKNFTGSCIYAFPISSPHLDKEVLKHYPFFDYIIVADEITMHSNSFRHVDFEVIYPNFAIMVILSFLGYLFYKELFVPKSGEPILAILASQNTFDSSLEKQILETVEERTLSFFSIMANREFAHRDEIFNLNNKKEINELTKNKEILKIGIGDQYSNLEDCINSRIKVGTQFGNPFQQYRSASEILFGFIGSKFRHICMLSSDCISWQQDPSLDSEHWLLYQWLMEYESKYINSIFTNKMSKDHILSLAIQSDTLSWLQNVPISDVLELRKNHTVEEIRNEFFNGRLNIRRCNINNFISVAEDVAKEINEVIESHHVNLEKLKRASMRKHSINAALLLMSSGIILSGVLFPPLAIPSAIASFMFGGKAVIDVAKDVKTRIELNKITKLRPVGFFYNMKHEKNLTQNKITQ